MAETLHHIYTTGDYGRDLTSPVNPETVSLLTEVYAGRFDKQKNDFLNGDSWLLAAKGMNHVATQYDFTAGRPYQFLPKDLVVQTEVKAHLYAQMLLHPQRIEALQSMQENMYEPTPANKKIHALEVLEEQGIAANSQAFMFRSLSDRQAILMGQGKEDLPSSAKTIMQKGLWVFSSNHPEYGVTMPIMGSSTPDTTSPRSASRFAVLQGRSWVPMDGFYSDINAQIEFLRETMREIEEDPVLTGHPNEQYLRDRSSHMVGISVKPNPRYALETLARFEKEGLMPSAVRVYDARLRSYQNEETVREIRNAYPEIVIFSGNNIDKFDARAQEEAGSNGIIAVIAGGGICTTSVRAKQAVENMKIIQDISANSYLPVTADSGTGDTHLLLVGAGGSAFMQAQRYIDVEKPPLYRWARHNKLGWISDYSGEAAQRTKKLGNKVDFLGNPLFPEGDDSYKDFKGTSVPENIYALNQDLATGLIFTRKKSLNDLRMAEELEIVKLDESSQVIGSAHHNNGNGNGK